jgi:hypothetical protein
VSVCVSVCACACTIGHEFHLITDIMETRPPIRGGQVHIRAGLGSKYTDTHTDHQQEISEQRELRDNNIPVINHTHGQTHGQTHI